MHDYVKLRINASPCSEDINDLLAAFLADEGFESFVPDEEGLSAYIRKDQFKPEAVKELCLNFPIECDLSYYHEVEEGKDWNEEWEKNYFKPILIDDLCVVHSSFHEDIPEAKYDILIDPKMAFGTGHHATTSSMMRLILDEDMNGKDVIDMGTGTGILAFLCKMKGARHVYAIEIDPYATENTRENALLNNIEIDIICGDASALEKIDKADIFMANINRNIITTDLHHYADKLKNNGEMFLSGFYKEDIPVVMEEAEKYGLQLKEIKEQDNWVALKLTKKLTNLKTCQLA